MSLMAQCLQPTFQFDRQGDRGQERGHLAGRQQGLIYLPVISSQKPARPVLLPVHIPSPSHRRLSPGLSSPATSSLTIFLSPTSFRGARLQSACLQLASFHRPLPPWSMCVCVCVCVHARCVCVCVCVCAWATRLSSSLRHRPPAHPTLSGPPGARPLCPHGTWAVLVSSCISLFSPLSLCPSSDLDRDFWNNNESTVQQKWSSYPPKEFILNISPYAPYGDPRLSLK